MDVLNSDRANDICEPVEPVQIQPDFFEPISSEVPVLLVSGAGSRHTTHTRRKGRKTFSSAIHSGPTTGHNVGMERCAAAYWAVYHQSN